MSLITEAINPKRVLYSVLESKLEDKADSILEQENKASEINSEAYENNNY
jgi:hypothetical protein